MIPVPRLAKRSIIAAASLGLAWMALSITTTEATHAAAHSGTQCPFVTKCPIDSTDSNYVSSEFSGITEIGIYEHALTSGGSHRFRMRCN